MGSLSGCVRADREFRDDLCSHVGAVKKLTRDGGLVKGHKEFESAPIAITGQTAGSGR